MSCPLCDDTGWKPVEINGVRRVERCECWRTDAGQKRLSTANIPRRYQHCTLANFEAYNDSLKRGVVLAQRVIDFGATARQAVTAPRLHTEGHEPAEVLDSVPEAVVEQLEAMGHQVKKAAAVGGSAQIVELLKNERKIRAGGNTVAAGIG